MEQILKIRWTREQPKKPGLYWFSPDGLPHQKRVEMELLGYDKDGKLHKLGEAPDWGPDTRYSFDPGFWAPVEYPEPPDKAVGKDAR